MARRPIFISYGLEDDEERKLGSEVKEIIDSQPGMECFLSGSVHSADELNTAVFKAIHDCQGFVAIMHQRGEIKYKDYELKSRSSVWIQQEIAILVYRRFLLNRVVPIRVYYEKGILLEGIMKNSIINPIEFKHGDEVKASVKEWITGPEFEKDPILSVREGLFQKRIQNLSENAWLLLELIAAHSLKPGSEVDKISVHDEFLDVCKTGKGMTDPKKIEDAYTQAFRALNARRLVEERLLADKATRVFIIREPWLDMLAAELKHQHR